MQHNLKWQTPNWLRVLCLTLLVCTTGLGAFAQTTVTITCTGSAGSFKSGSVNSGGTKNDGNMITINSTANRGWANYDLSSLGGATITAVTAEFTTYSTTLSGAINNVYGFTGDPAVLTGTSLYAACASGTSFNASTWSANALQSKVLNASGIAFIQANVGGNANIGYVRGSTNTYNIYGYSGVTPPKLIITYTGGAACTGTPNPGNTIASAASVCNTVPFNLSLQNATSGSGVTYQWQSADDAAFTLGVTNLGTGPTQSTTQSAAKYYRCQVTCAGNTGTSNPVQVGLTTGIACLVYCSSAATSTADEDISNVTFGTLNNSSTCSSLAPGPGSSVSLYSNYRSGTGAPAAPVVSQLQTVPFSVTQTSCGGAYTNVTGIYIDYNQNGSFTDPGENVFTSAAVSGNHTDAGNITIPLSASVGFTVMRVVNVESSVVSPCGTYTWGETEDYLIEIVATTACSGAPNPGNTLASQNPVCPNTNVILSLQNPPVSTGNTFQWFNNTYPGGIPGATDNTYTVVGFNAADDYYCDVTCNSVGGSTTSSGLISLTLNSFMNCYCAANSSFGTSGLFYGVISNVNFNTLNQASSAPAASPYYTNYSPTGTTVSAGSPYPISVSLPQYGQAAVWVDWNQNGLFENTADEFMFMGNNGTATPTTYTQTINVPISALAGTTRMRVRSEAYFYANLTGTQSCGNTNYGETEDYEITVVIPMPCAGMPAPGNTTASATSVCYGTVVNFGISNTNNGTGITYQWYNNSGAISGATNAFYSQAITSASDDFYCDLTCTNTNDVASSNIVTVTLAPFYNCYCASAPTQTADEEIYQVTLNGNSTNALYANAAGCTTVAPGPGSVLSKYSNFTGLGALAQLTQAAGATLQVRENECDGATFFNNGIGVWIDYNQNGVFTDPGEAVYIEATTSAATGASPGGDKVINATFTVPLTALTGFTTMRVITAEGYSGTGLTPCLAYGYGETEDHLIEILQTTACTGTPTPGNTLATQNPVCPNTNVTLSLQTPPTTTGNTYQWYENNVLIPGATDATYTVSNFTTAADYYCDVTCTTTSQTASSSTISLTLNSFLNCYCPANSSFGTSGLFYGVITNVSMDAINNSSSAPTVSPYYTDYAPGAGTTATLVAGNPYPCSVTLPQYGQAAVWFDWNQNGLFGDTPDEFMFMGNNGTNVSATYTQVINVPIGALAGSTKMRVRSEAYFYGNLLITQSCGNTNYGETEDYTISIVIPVACSGAPAPGATLASSPNVCPGTAISFSLSNPNNGTGVTYQWYNNAGAVSGATNSYYSQIINATDNVYAAVTCTASATTTNSTPVAVGLSPFFGCYCSSLPSQTADEEIYNVTVNGASTDPLYANANGCSTVAPGPGSILSKYSNFKTLPALTTITQGNLVTFEIRENECDGATYYSNGIGMWIDYNHNGLFTDAGEAIYIDAATSPATGLSPGGDKVVSGSFTVPVSSLTGLTAMRVITAEGYSGPGLTPCLQYGYGETEDYLIDIAAAFACSGTPAPGNTIASATSACPNASVTFTLQNNLGSGITYQWYNNANPSGIAGATNASYTQVMTAADNVYCTATCTNSGLSGSSTPVAVSMAPFFNCYCTSNLGGICGTQSINSVAIATTTLNNITNGCTTPYNAFPASGSTTATLVTTNAYSMTVGTGNNGNPAQIAVWIDYDQSGTYDASEYTQISASSPSGGSSTGTITIPGTALLGNTGMRVRTDWELSATVTGTMACTQLPYGETEDYVVTIVAATACSGAPTPGAAQASVNPVCPNGTTVLSLSIPQTASGLTYQWYNGAGAIAGATDVTYTATITAADTYHCDVTCTNSSTTVSSTSVSVTLNTLFNCYCAAGATNGCAFGDEYVGNFTLNTINNSSTCGTSTYSNYTSISTNLTQGQSYTASVLIPNWFAGDQASVWIDLDHNGILDDVTEQFPLLNGGGNGTTPLDGTITIPMTALTGPTLARVRGAYVGTMTACGNMSYGEVEDYIVVIDPAVTNTVISLNAFIEGYWDGTSAMLPVLFNQGQGNPLTDCDTIEVQLYNSSVTSPLPAPDYSTLAVLHTDGTATATFTSAISGNYYIAIKHRSALLTFSAAPIAMAPAVSYNFTTAATQAYGGNQVQIAAGVYALYSGDIVFDENMDLLDLSKLETDIGEFVFGYNYDPLNTNYPGVIATDLNGDGNTDLLDSPILESNISNFVFSSHP